MFTKEELENKIVEITEQCKKDFEESKEQFLNWKDGDKLPEYCFTESIESESFEDQYTPDQMIDMLSEFKKEVEGLPYHISGSYNIKLSAYSRYDDNDAYIEDNHYTYEYYIHKEELPEYTVKQKVKQWINEQLQPESAIYRQPVDCKLLELFKEGTIDFKALQKLTYTNCNL